MQPLLCKHSCDIRQRVYTVLLYFVDFALQSCRGETRGFVKVKLCYVTTSCAHFVLLQDTDSDVKTLVHR